MGYVVTPAVMRALVAALDALPPARRKLAATAATESTITGARRRGVSVERVYSAIHHRVVWLAQVSKPGRRGEVSEEAHDTLRAARAWVRAEVARLWPEEER